jgi:hypothetical protein
MSQLEAISSIQMGKFSFAQRPVAPLIQLRLFASRVALRLLKLLIHVRPVEHIRVPQPVTKDQQLRRTVIDFAVVVPHLQDVKALLGADADAHNRVAAVRSSGIQNGGRSVALESLMRSCLWDLDAVGAAVDVATVLPHRRERVAHQEEHARQKVLNVNALQRTPKSFKGPERPQLVVAGRRPVSIIWRVEIECPRARRKGRCCGRRSSHGGGSGCHLILVRKERIGRS